MDEIERQLAEIKSLLEKILAQLDPMYTVSTEPMCNCASHAGKQQDAPVPMWYCPVHGWQS